ncbi:MAG: hypothetical protein CL726_11850 [Chloroflexi bacterium]|nr:hypothetical protein [Chloroflexota bacterium]|tara:strand:+ start:3500 stop:4345 length:846 start_codon:yes stop_codon:yes gene_type:complete
MKISKNLPAATFALAVLLVALGVGDLDYTISKAVAGKSSVFGEFFNRVGEVPAYMGMVVGIAILYGGRRRDILWSNILGNVLGLPLLALFSYMLVAVPFYYAYEHTQGGVPKSVAIGIFVSAAVIFLGALLVINNLGEDKIRQYRKHGLILILLIVAEILIVNVLKVLWARPRMRSVESIEQFQHWFQINGPTWDNELKSFPSGHTSNAFAVIAYSMFIPETRRLYVKLFLIGALTWGSLVALSRVIRGDHFLSDVVVGGYITVFLFYLLSQLFQMKRDAK